VLDSGWRNVPISASADRVTVEAMARCRSMTPVGTADEGALRARCCADVERKINGEEGSRPWH
jgi:hypothetical protein